MFKLQKKIQDNPDLKKQWQLHRNHTGPANIARKKCVYCIKEGINTWE